LRAWELYCPLGKINKKFLVLFSLALTGLQGMAWEVWGWQGGLVVAGVLLNAILVSVIALYSSFARFGARGTEAVAQRRAYRQMQALAYLHATIRLRLPLPFLGDIAVLPDFAACLAGLIREIRPRRILELGSGASTIVAGYVLEELGEGELLSLDHEELWANQTRERLALHRVAARTRVEFAPLREVTAGTQWYGYDRLADFGPIDLLVVDGPPDRTGKMARYPALPMVLSMLSGDAVILIDDFARADETEMVRLWMQSFPGFTLEKLDFEKGAAILRRKAHA
jgi:predicted O-methyltransferase YrrM